MSSVTGYSPYQALHGGTCRLPTTIAVNPHRVEGVFDDDRVAAMARINFGKELNGLSNSRERLMRRNSRRRGCHGEATPGWGQCNCADRRPETKLQTKVGR